MDYKKAYEKLKRDLFLTVRKKQGKYYLLQKNGRKRDIIRELVNDLDLDDEYWDYLQREVLTNQQIAFGGERK